MWGYVAGLLVGEGCFLVSGSPRRPIFSLAVDLGDYEVCAHLHRLFGGAVHLSHRGQGHVVRSRKHIKTTWKWRINDGFTIVAVMRRVIPYLVGAKRRQAKAYLQFADLKLRLWKRRYADSRREYTAKEQLALLRKARVARDFAGGGQKGWKVRWDEALRRLEEEVVQ